jgi:hypothetical protein
VKGINQKNRHKWEYPSAPTSVKLPTQHSDDVSVPSIPFTAEQILQTSVDDDLSETRSENDSKFDIHHQHLNDFHKTSSRIVRTVTPCNPFVLCWVVATELDVLW